MLTLTTPSFRNYQEIPVEYTGDGFNRSPAMNWEDAPLGIREYALLCEDPDAPQEEPFCHWLIYNLSPLVNYLPAGIPKKARLDAPAHGIQGQNDFGQVGYGGPLPPVGHGRHRYFFRLFALDKKLHLPPELRRAEFLRAIEKNILAQTEIVGLYERVQNLRVAGGGWAP